MVPVLFFSGRLPKRNRRRNVSILASFRVRFAVAVTSVGFWARDGGAASTRVPIKDGKDEKKKTASRIKRHHPVVAKRKPVPVGIFLAR